MSLLNNILSFLILLLSKISLVKPSSNIAKNAFKQSNKTKKEKQKHKAEEDSHPQEVNQQFILTKRTIDDILVNNNQHKTSLQLLISQAEDVQQAYHEKAISYQQALEQLIEIQEDAKALAKVNNSIPSQQTTPTNQAANPNFLSRVKSMVSYTENKINLSLKKASDPTITDSLKLLASQLDSIKNKYTRGSFSYEEARQQILDIQEDVRSLSDSNASSSQEEPPKTHHPRTKLPADNYYTLLGLSPDASTQQIKEAYIGQLQKYHPDKYNHDNQEKKNQARKKSQQINEAYTILTHPQRRKDYDRKLQLKEAR